MGRIVAIMSPQHGHRLPSAPGVPSSACGVVDGARSHCALGYHTRRHPHTHIRPETVFSDALASVSREDVTRVRRMDVMRVILALQTRKVPYQGGDCVVLDNERIKDCASQVICKTSCDPCGATQNRQRHAGE